jgi:hypothetical protein
MTTMFQLMQTTFGRRILQWLSNRTNLETPKVQRVCVRKNLNLRLNQVQENQPPTTYVEVRVLQDRDGPGRLGNRKKWLNLRQHAALWHCANDLCLDLAFVE